MMKKGILLVASILAALMAGASLFLVLPYLAEYPDVLYGLLGSLGLILTAGVVWFLIRRPKRTSQTPHSSTGNSPNFLLHLLLVVSVIVLLFLVIRQHLWIQNQIDYQEQMLVLQKEQLEAGRAGHLIPLMSHLLEQVSDELDRSAHRSLSSSTISRLAALSNAFMPDAFFSIDSISIAQHSTERGQLLLNLVYLNIDTVSLQRIFEEVSFMGADLRDADLEKAYLNGADLRGANLLHADLTGAQMIGTDLRAADLQYAQLTFADLTHALARRTNMRWVQMDSIQMDGGDLSGAQLQSAKLRGASLTNAQLYDTHLEDAVLSGADLSGSILHFVHLDRTQLQGANFQNVSLKWAYIHETVLRNTELSGVIVDLKDWTERLDSWQVSGAKEIQEQYVMQEGGVPGAVTYSLVKKAQ